MDEPLFLWSRAEVRKSRVEVVCGKMNVLVRNKWLVYACSTNKSDAQNEYEHVVVYYTRVE